MIDKHQSAWIEEGSQVGPGCSIGPYAIVRAGAVLGEGCVVEAQAVVSGGVLAGKGVTLGSGCFIGPGAQLAAGVRISPRASVDSRVDESVLIGQEAVIGSQAVIHAGVTIGNQAVIEAGAVVMRNVPATAVVSGNPAKIIRYVTTPRAAPPIYQPDQTSPIQTGVRGVTIHHLPLIEDLRGNLSFGEASRHVPFEIKRYFLTFEVAGEEIRGEHAHRKLQQFLICPYGRLHLMADDGRNREEFILDRPNLALYLPPLVWGVQYRFSPGAVLLVFCSDYYDPADYIRDYVEFVALVRDGPDA